MAAQAPRGRFITIEGPDGGGKTTQAERLRDHLIAVGQSVHLTREPGGTWLGERLREVLLARTGDESSTDTPGTTTASGTGPTTPAGTTTASGTTIAASTATAAGTAPATTRDPLTDAFLFNAARRQLVREVIRPALDSGMTVICARYADSTLAYQGYGAGVDLAQLRAMADIATDGLQPDLTIVLDLPVEVGLARKAPGDVTRFEAEFDVDFHRRVRDGFLALAAAEPARFVVIDASAGVDDVARRVRETVDAAREPAGEGATATTGDARRSEPQAPFMRIHR
jgi:dTMP kinase